jgi:salicylate hydroxylase
VSVPSSFASGRDGLPVLIAGGGIGGLALALALARAGIASEIMERRPVWSEAGAGIQLSPNGMAVLERLGVAARLAASAGVPDEIVVRDAASSRVLQRLPLGPWIAVRHGAPYWVAHRRDLQAALLAAVAAEPLVTVSQGFEVSSLDTSATDRVAAIASDGRRREGRVLVGADGLFSRLRDLSLGSGAPRFAGRTAARTVIAAPDTTERAALLSTSATGVWLAAGAHMVHYPVRAGREIALVYVARESWQETEWSAPVDEAAVMASLSAAAPALATAIGRGHEWRRWALFQLAPLPRWSKGRVTLLGDAAHPTLPFLAQGGSLALEDAWSLSRCLAAAGAHGSIESALAAYETLRRDRTTRVVAAAARNDRIFHLAGPAAVARNLAMSLIPGTRVMAGYDWVYGWKPA